MVSMGHSRVLVLRRRPLIRRMLKKVPISVWRILVFVILMLAWTLVARYSGQNFVPSPGETAIAAAQLFADGVLLTALLSSLLVFFFGYLLAVVVAIPLGLLMGGFRVFGAALEPYVDAFGAMPRVAFIPLIIVFLGLGNEAKICVVFLGAVMPILLNTYVGVLNGDRELIEMARSTGAGDFQIFCKIMLPDSMPYIVAGMRIGAALALINTVVAELYTAVQGLGGLLAIYGNSFRMAPYFVVVFVLGAVGLLTMQSLKFVERRLVHRRHTQT